MRRVARGGMTTDFGRVEGRQCRLLRSKRGESGGEDWVCGLRGRRRSRRTRTLQDIRVSNAKRGEGEKATANLSRRRVDLERPQRIQRMRTSSRAVSLTIRPIRRFIRRCLRRLKASRRKSGEVRTLRLPRPEGPRRSVVLRPAPAAHNYHLVSFVLQAPALHDLTDAVLSARLPVRHSAVPSPRRRRPPSSSPLDAGKAPVRPNRRCRVVLAPLRPRRTGCGVVLGAVEEGRSRGRAVRRGKGEVLVVLGGSCEVRG